MAMGLMWSGGRPAWFPHWEKGREKAWLFQWCASRLLACRIPCGWFANKPTCRCRAASVRFADWCWVVGTPLGCPSTHSMTCRSAWQGGHPPVPWNGWTLPHFLKLLFLNNQNFHCRYFFMLILGFAYKVKGYCASNNGLAVSWKHLAAIGVVRRHFLIRLRTNLKCRQKLLRKQIKTFEKSALVIKCLILRWI